MSSEGYEEMYAVGAATPTTAIFLLEKAKRELQYDLSKMRREIQDMKKTISELTEYIGEDKLNEFRREKEDMIDQEKYNSLREDYDAFFNCRV